MRASAHREEQDHPIGKIIGTVAPGVTADWMAVAMVLTQAGRITHRNVEAFNGSSNGENFPGYLAALAWLLTSL